MKKDFNVSEKLLSIRLSEALEHRGINQAELSEKSGVARSQLSRYVTGNNKGKIPADVLFAIADALQCSARWLIGRSDDPGYYDELSRVRFAKPEQIPIDLSLAYAEIRKRQKDALISMGISSEEADAEVALLESITRLHGSYRHEALNYIKYLESKSQAENESKDSQ